MRRFLHLAIICRLISQIVTTLLLVSAIASGQYVLTYQKDGAANNNQLGFSVALLGDVNGDGQSDFAIGAPYADPGGRMDAGSVFVYSGATGALLYQKDGATAGDRFGWQVARVGTVDTVVGDDFIVGAPYTDPNGNIDAGSAFVYSGQTGAQIYRIDHYKPGVRTGWSVGGVGDVNNDLKFDFIVGVPFDSSFGVINRGYFAVFSGANASVLSNQQGLATGDLMGWSVSGAGDVNGDGRSDYIVGVPGADDLTAGRTDAGYADVYSGLNYGLLYRKYGGASFDSLGYSVGIAGDMTADSKAEFIIGAPTADPSGLGNAGSVYVYSGATGNVLYQKNGAAIGYRLGKSVSGAGDVNSDGKTDFIVGAPLATAGGFPSAGSAYVYSGANGNVLFQKDGSATNDQLGYSVAGNGDINGSLQADFVISAPLANPGGLTDAGSAFVFSDNISDTLSLVLLHQKSGTDNDYFGISAGITGDVNGDQYADFIVGAPLDNTGGIGAGTALVYSGANGALLYQKNGPSPGYELGRSTAGAGDVDGDGKNDFIVGSVTSGSVFVYSGFTGALLYQKNGVAGEMFGVSVDGAGDVNGDGKADFIVGAPEADPGGITDAGSVYIYSGVTGALIYQKNGTTSDQGFGWSVAGAGDVNGDGKSDFIIGMTGLGIDISTQQCHAYVYSGATGNLLYQKDGIVQGNAFGYSVDGAGDVNGDGKSDFIVGSPLEDPAGVKDAGSVYIYSGADGSLLRQKNGPVGGAAIGQSVAGTGDVNGDGRADFIVGSTYYAGFVYVVSGLDGKLLSKKIGSSSNQALGFVVGGGSDVNQDGKADIIASTIGSNPKSVFVYGLPCPKAKGDMNGDGYLTPADEVLMMNCVYQGTGDCRLCFADVNCNGEVGPSDAVLLSRAVWQGEPFPC